MLELLYIIEVITCIAGAIIFTLAFTSKPELLWLSITVNVISVIALVSCLFFGEHTDLPLTIMGWVLAIASGIFGGFSISKAIIEWW